MVLTSGILRSNTCPNCSTIVKPQRSILNLPDSALKIDFVPFGGAFSHLTLNDYKLPPPSFPASSSHNQQPTWQQQQGYQHSIDKFNSTMHQMNRHQTTHQQHTSPISSVRQTQVMGSLSNPFPLSRCFEPDISTETDTTPTIHPNANMVKKLKAAATRHESG